MKRTFLWFSLLALGCTKLSAYYDGHLDSASCGSILGWAWDTTQPNTPIGIDLYTRDTSTAPWVQFATTTADKYSYGIGNNYHGFSFLMPNYLKNGYYHYVQARISGTSTVLNDLPFACNPNSSGYSYYYSDTLTTINGNWSQNGSLTATSGGLTSSSSTGGSLISTVAVPDGSSDYEVKGTITLAGNDGKYVLYLRASPDALSGPSYTTGTYYSVELKSPTFTGNVCSATVYLYKRFAGVVTLLGSNVVSCHSGMTLRATHTGGQFGIYVDNKFVLWASDSDITTGQPGVGVRSVPTGSSIALVELGPQDRTTPFAVPTQGFSASSFPNHVDLQWQNAVDDSYGTGLAYYILLRNGVQVADVNSPEYSDSTVAASTTYTYSLIALDYHQNQSIATTITITTPAAASSDPRRVGVRPTGASWGSGGENIDLLSGNLNISLPLLKAQARGGWGVGFNLSYNSQNWRIDSSGTWNFGRDIGYGFGWKLLAGSLTPYWSDYFSLHHYIFTDATGAEYRLDQNTAGVWASKESTYVYYDSNVGRLYFRDGSFWVLGSTAAGTEQDAGAMYPTVFQDSNGNQILVSYQHGQGVAWANSSGRIVDIEDVRAPSGGKTYTFGYDPSAVPHLMGISNSIGTGENYTFNFAATQSLVSPVSAQVSGLLNALANVQVNGNGLQHSFIYNSAGELTQLTLPYGGYMRYAYAPYTYAGSRSQDEITTRYLSKDGTSGSEKAYTFAHEPSSGSNLHQYTVLDDPGGVGEKYWAFGTSGSTLGLVTQYQGRQLPGPVTKIQNDLAWTQDGAGNNYIASAMTTADPGQSYVAQMKTEQTVDLHGNVTQVKTYNYGNLSTPYRTDNFTYLSTSAYTSGYIFNRVTSTPTSTIAYDQSSLVSLSSPREWDSSIQSVTARGNPTTITTLGDTQTMIYDVTGGVNSATADGVTKNVTTTSSTNYAAPSQITVGSLQTSMNYNSVLQLSSETGPNGWTVSVGYDSMARPNTSTSKLGAVTTITYNDTSNPPTVTSTINGRWSKKTMDGLGRTIKVETGDGSGTVSVAETEYDSCGCSPIGKTKRTALSHAPGASPVWTTYTYDGIGRTLTASIVGTDSQGTTSYVYQGNTATVTDAAGKWKKITMNALGQAIQVNEPNPAGGSDYVTTYAYDTLGHLTSVSMPRPTGTQTRTFNYGTPPGMALLSTTNPENGTVTYTYNSDKTLATKTDAKGQQIQYSYDSLKRITQVRRYLPIGGQLVEDTCQQENYGYDFGSYGLGRLVEIQYKGGYTPGASPTCTTTFDELYNYNAAGSILTKNLWVTEPAKNYYFGGSVSMVLTANYSYDNEGRITETRYPSWWGQDANHPYYPAWLGGPDLVTTYDTMGRPQTETVTDQLYVNTNVITNATYGPMNQLLSLAGMINESRTYNSLGQMTQLQSGSLNAQYAYPATQNNSKITSETDVVSGEQIVYTYDSLNRLASATSSVNPGWGQSYSYDGFDNLTNQTVIKGTAPSLSVSYDPATNRQSGECADANGNLNSASNCTNGNYYDIENRLVRNGGSTLAWAYSYAPGNKRIWRGAWDSSGNQTVEEIVFWSITGEKLTTYQVSQYQPNGYYQTPKLVATSPATTYYFGGRLVKNAGGYVNPDRLGSIGKYFPYGQERPSATTDGKEKFATYFRDSETGLDYAQNRYYQPGAGRFLTPDPAQSGLNWYSYAGGDPVNNSDPSGFDWYFCGPEGKELCDTQSFTVYSGSGDQGFNFFGWGSYCWAWGGCYTQNSGTNIYPGGDVGSTGGGGGLGGGGSTNGSGSTINTSGFPQFDFGQLTPPPTFAFTTTACAGENYVFNGTACVPKPTTSSQQQPFCINPSGCGPSAPTITNNFALALNLTLNPSGKGADFTATYVPGTNSGLVGFGLVTGVPDPSLGKSFSFLVSPNGSPIAPILLGPSLTVTGILPGGFGGTFVLGSGGSIALGVTIGSPTFGWSLGDTFCLFCKY